MEKKTPSSVYSVFCLVVSFAVVMLPALFFGAKIQPLFFLSWMLAFFFCIPLGYSFKELQTGMFQFMSRCLLPISVCITVGAMIGVWCSCGTVAYVMKLCLTLINPRFYLVITFIICLIFAVLTGTSFGTVGTVGIAMMGVGLGLGINPLIISAPIITAAYIGDGLSPLSGNTNICAGTIGIDLFQNVKYQSTMSLPLIAAHIVLYLIWGGTLKIGAFDETAIHAIVTSMEASYKMNFICLIPIIVVMIMLLKRIPVIPSLLGGVLSGFLVALYQGRSFSSLATSMWSGYILKGDNDLVNSIFSRGGITSMESATFMFILAFGLFGIFTTAGVIDKAVEPLLKRVKSRTGCMLCAFFLGAFGNATSGSGQFTNMFTCSLMTPIYEKNHQNLWDLSRVIPVGCLYIGLLMPWNSNPLTVCGFLNVNPSAMIPYLLPLPLIAFMIVLFYSVTGIDKKFSKFARGEIAPRE